MSASSRRPAHGAVAAFSISPKSRFMLPLLLSFLLLVTSWPHLGAAMRPARVAQLRREVVEMFYHGYDNYMEIAFPEDEVRGVPTKLS